MASAVDSRLAYARLSAVATASRLPTATRGSSNSYTTSWDTTETYWIGSKFDKQRVPTLSSSGLPQCLTLLGESQDWRYLKRVARLLARTSLGVYWSLA